jgi:transcriptional regulator with XRE-family HTH domain
MTFAEKLRELRDARGLSEARLADASGLPLATLHNYGLGRRKPSLAAAVKLARALGVTCEAFADCEDVAGEEADKGKPEPKPARTRSALAPSPAGAKAEPKEPRDRGKGKK